MSDEQRLKDLMTTLVEGEAGIVLLAVVEGELPYLSSPIPDLQDYQIVCAAGDGFDIWRDDTVVQANQTAEQIGQWLASQTPDWILSTDPPTPEQARLVTEWIWAAHQRHERVCDADNPCDTRE